MWIRFLSFIAALGLAAAFVADAGTGLPLAVSAAVADSHRPAEQTKLDAARKPEQLIAFAGIKPGERVLDFMPGNAYFTRIFSKLVGANGRVYAFIPEEEIKNCDASEIAGSRAIEHDPEYPNVEHLSGPIDRFAPLKRLDVIWTAQNYHDLHDSFLGPADVARLNKRFFNSLKPGGVLLIIDHAAAAGSGLRDTENLHRIDPLSVRREVEAAGFVFAGELDALKNPADDRVRSVFDPAIRGRTDQFVYKFMKPAGTR